MVNINIISVFIILSFPVAQFLRFIRPAAICFKRDAFFTGAVCPFTAEFAAYLRFGFMDGADIFIILNLLCKGQWLLFLRPAGFSRGRRIHAAEKP